MPRKTLRGLPSASRISAARSWTASVLGELDEALGVDRDREGGGLHGPAVGEVDEVAVGLVPDPPPHQADEVGRTAGELEADQVGAEQPLEDLAAPRQLAEQLGGRERDVEVEADPQVGAQLAQHLRHQLELVVLHPDGGVLGGDLGGALGEALVDPDVGVPPLAVELRLGHEVVVERPQGAVGEALVELLDLLGGQVDRHQLEAVLDERLRARCRRSSPASRSRRRRWRASRVRGRRRGRRVSGASRRCRPGGSPGPRGAGWRRSRGRPGLVGHACTLVAGPAVPRRECEFLRDSPRANDIGVVRRLQWAEQDADSGDQSWTPRTHTSHPRVRTPPG